MKNVIHIYGASGSGTSTLGRKISQELCYKFMDTDDYFWLPTNPQYTTKRSKAERLALMKKDILENDNVVIAGSLVDWGDELIPFFTLTAGTQAAASSVEMVTGLLEYFTNINKATDEASQTVSEEYQIIDHVKNHFNRIQEEIETLVATSEENSATIQNITETISDEI